MFKAAANINILSTVQLLKHIFIGSLLLNKHMHTLPLLIITLLIGCSNPYEDCIEQQRAEYRSRNPSASYGQITGKQSEFEMMCSRLKT